MGGKKCSTAMSNCPDRLLLGPPLAGGTKIKKKSTHSKQFPRDCPEALPAKLGGSRGVFDNGLTHSLITFVLLWGGGSVPARGLMFRPTQSFA